MNVQLPSVPAVRTAMPNIGARRPLEVRPATRTDVGAIRAYFDTLDADSRRLRFHCAVNAVPESVLAIFGEADQRRRITRVAVDDEAASAVLGEAMLVAPEGSASGELALSVAARCRRIGIGERLLSSVLDAAADARLRSVHADVLAENEAFVGLAMSHGFEWGRHPQDPTLLRMIRAVERRRGGGRSVAHRIAGRIG